MEAYSWGIWFVFMIVCFVVAERMNDLLRQRNPGAESYTWGYFLGVGGTVSWLFFAGLSLILLVDAAPDAGLFLLFGLVGAAMSFGLVLRNRWWSVLATLVTFNPIVYVVNIFYLKNRWSELGGIDDHYLPGSLKPWGKRASPDRTHTQSPAGPYTSQPGGGEMTFKSNEAAFEYCCRFMDTEIKPGHGIAALVLDAQARLGATRSIPPWS